VVYERGRQADELRCDRVSIQEEWHASHDNARAVHEGISRVSGIITGAAIIMIAVFGSFVLGGQLLLRQFGVGFAVAVALDAFLIRFALLPALMYIIGDRNWRLPGWLDWLPRVQIEPAACSNAYASASSLGSVQAGPMNVTPTGSPDTVPAGTEIDG
jgi:putative drug exporter of the RND superfamily